MSRDVGSFEESKRVQSTMEKRESGYDSPAPAPGSMKWQSTFKGGKMNSTLGTAVDKPSTGKVRKHME